jgi:hypothetical protein
MMFELKRIDFFSAIKVSFLVHLVIGLLVGIFIGSILAFIFSFLSQFMPYDQTGLGGPPLGALGAFGGIFMVIFYALFISIVNGIIVTAVVVLLYNLFAGWVGGIKFNLKEAPVNIKPAATYAKPPSDTGDTTA